MTGIRTIDIKENLLAGVRLRQQSIRSSRRHRRKHRAPVAGAVGARLGRLVGHGDRYCCSRRGAAPDVDGRITLQDGVVLKDGIQQWFGGEGRHGQQARQGRGCET